MQHSSQISKHALSCTQGGTHQNAATFVAKKNILLNHGNIPFLFCPGSSVFLQCFQCFHCLLAWPSLCDAQIHYCSGWESQSFLSVQACSQTLLSSVKKYVDSITKNPCFVFGSSVFLRCFNVFIACLLHLLSDVQIHYCCCDTFTRFCPYKMWFWITYNAHSLFVKFVHLLYPVPFLWF